MSAITHTDVYRGLFALYPRGFRSIFEDEMLGVFAERIEAARRQGGSSVARVWLRELRSLPAAALEAHTLEEGTDAPKRLDRMIALVYRVRILALALGLAVGLSAAGAASHLLTVRGLFFPLSLALLIGGLTLAGFFAGIAPRFRDERRRGRMTLFASLLLLLALAVPAGFDFMKVRGMRTPQRISIPGVELSAARFPSMEAASSLLENARRSEAPSLSIRTAAVERALVVTVVRSAGVDGTYLLLAFLLISGASATGAYVARAPRLIA